MLELENWQPTSTNVFNSAESLVYHIANQKTNVTQLSVGKPLYDISLSFKKYLKLYVDFMLDNIRLYEIKLL